MKANANMKLEENGDKIIGSIITLSEQLTKTLNSQHCSKDADYMYKCMLAADIETAIKEYEGMSKKK